MNPFTQHTQQQGLTYSEHTCFAIAIAWRLLHTVVVFFMHGIFPFIAIAPELDLEATAEFLEAQNRWLENDNRRRVTDVESQRFNAQ